MMTGYAIGGPRNNVKLSAPLVWDGRIRLKSPKDAQQQPTSTELRKAFYPGRYKWNPDYQQWIWISDK